MQQAKTSTGLKVTVDILNGVYTTGKKCAENFRETMRIVFLAGTIAPRLKPAKSGSYSGPILSSRDCIPAYEVTRLYPDAI
jgi:hypothetical protein